MKSNNLISAIILLISLVSCDIIDQPFIEDGNYCGNDSVSFTIKKVLIEDFSGHKCGNCPRAKEQLDILENKYCDHIISITIHSGFFSTLNSSGKSIFICNTL